ncbi:MAG: histidine phosphatase family protein [Anaerovoracaceae bacterium]|jgi:broad specificity phosphatase PhoE
MKIYIIRHGETDCNRKSILAGWLDVPLNEKGRELAKITAEALSDVKFDCAFSSPLSRAYETAEIMLRYNSHEAPGIVKDDRLREMYFGSWEGLCFSPDNFELPTKDFNKLYSDPFDFRNAPDGESTRQVCDRTGEFYRELIHREDLKDSTVLVATHGYALRCLLQQLYDDQSFMHEKKVADNCAVNIIEVKDGKSTRTGKNLIYYDKSLSYNPYGPVDM